jgi:hypothetical protein
VRGREGERERKVVRKGASRRKCKKGKERRSGIGRNEIERMVGGVKASDDLQD